MQLVALLGLCLLGCYIVRRLSIALHNMRHTIRYTERWHRLRMEVHAWYILSTLLVAGLLLAGGLQWFGSR